MIPQMREHYEHFWQSPGVVRRWPTGPMASAYPDFSILEIPPARKRVYYTYATLGMSVRGRNEEIELHLHAASPADDNVLILTMVSFFHLTDCQLGLGHTVNFGQGWKSGSACTHGLVSLPYLDGPKLEQSTSVGLKGIRFLWLLPITKEEVEYKKKNGLGALEKRFEDNRKSFNYLDPERLSVVL